MIDELARAAFDEHTVAQGLTKDMDEAIWKRQAAASAHLPKFAGLLFRMGFVMGYMTALTRNEAPEVP